MQTCLWLIYNAADNDVVFVVVLYIHRYNISSCIQYPSSTQQLIMCANMSLLYSLYAKLIEIVILFVYLSTYTKKNLMLRESRVGRAHNIAFVCWINSTMESSRSYVRRRLWLFCMRVYCIICFGFEWCNLKSQMTSGDRNMSYSD